MRSRKQRRLNRAARIDTKVTADVLALADQYDSISLLGGRTDGKPIPHWLPDVAEELRDAVKRGLAR